jgi:hypothetical protein
METGVKIAIGIVAAALLGWGGWRLSHSLACSGYEEDYLNAVASYKSSVIGFGALGDQGDVADELDQLRDLQLKEVGISLQRVYDECGARAGQTAARKGTELIL